MTFSGSPGTVRSEAENMVAGYGSSVVHNSQAFTASMTPRGINPLWIHTYIFTIVSITFYRAVSRAKNYVSTFRTQV